MADDGVAGHLADEEEAAGSLGVGKQQLIEIAKALAKDVRLLRVRDGVCRFPFCDAPIRHDDHVVSVTLGGATTAHNGQGLCARHNLTKARPGWRSATVEARAGGESSAASNAPEVVMLTPTGHRYGSPVPPVLERLPEPSLPDPSSAEAQLLSMLPCRDRMARRRRRVDVLTPDVLRPATTIELLDTG